MVLDIAKCQKAGEATIEFLKMKKVNNFDYFYLIESAFIDFKSQLDNEIPIDEIYYSAVDLYRLCKSDETDSDKARKYLARHFKKLSSFMDENIDEYAEFIKDKDTDSWLNIVPDGSKGKKKNTYFLNLNLVGESLELNVGDNDFQNITYRVSQLKRTPWFAKPFANFKFDGYRRFAPVFLIVLVYIVFLTFIFSSVGWLPKNWLSVLMLALGLLGFVIYAFLPYFKVLNRSIVEAPQWLLPIKQYSAQIELVNTGEKREDGSIIREIRTVVYDGVCPICQGKVNITQSGKEFHHRLIGQCEEARYEHLFSFDHITKKGKLLR